MDREADRSPNNEDNDVLNEWRNCTVESLSPVTDDSNNPSSEINSHTDFTSTDDESIWTNESLSSNIEEDDNLMENNRLAQNHSPAAGYVNSPIEDNRNQYNDSEDDVNVDDEELFYDSSDEMSTDSSLIDSNDLRGNLRNFREVEIEPDNLINNFPNLNRYLNEDESNEIITTPLVVIRNEVLLALLKFVLFHAISMSSFENLLKIINAMFESAILPNSRYLIDKLFCPESEVQYHAVCPQCKRYIKSFKRSDRIIHCQLCDLDIGLKDPTYTDFFAIINVDNEIIS
ncbi:hypothetical protein TKK_0017113 [Trichogramma kaykai]